MAEAPPLKKPVFIKIKDLMPDSRGHNIFVKVVKIDVVLERERKLDSTKLVIAEALVGDETGCVLLTLKNEQVDLAQVGATIVLRNAKVEMFKGHMRVSVDRWGLIKSAKEENKVTQEVKIDNNLSETEYELVKVD